MNRQQKEYAVAKALYETLTEEQREHERKFVESKNITNPDGTKATYLFTITDDDLFERVCEEYDSNEESNTLSEERMKAYTALEAAEENLIRYALSIVPDNIAGTLRSSRNYGVRKKILDLAFRLDTRTVPKNLRK